MKITLSKDSLLTARVDVLALGIYSDKPLEDPTVAQLDQAMDGAFIDYLKEEEFKGEKGETFMMAARGKLLARQILLIGLGSAKEGVSESSARLLGVIAGRAAQKRSSLAVAAPGQGERVLRAIAYGIASGAYQYTRYLTGSHKPKRLLENAYILADGASARSRDAVHQGTILGEALGLTRDLINCPANDMSPEALADAAAQASRAAGIECKVFDKKAIAKLGMPLLLAVNQGSNREPRFVHMTYKPKHSRKDAVRVVLVGKGLTFDSGGLCVKPPASMNDMKSDMAGAAVTIGTLVTAARLKLPIEVHGIIAATDNLIGPDAYRPGDVFPSRKGKSVEIINTDAEGRLILADALTYACELNPTYVIDHATLTGACVVALGDYTSGLFANDEELAAKYLKAGSLTGESFWRLPLDKELKEQLKSDIADIKHTSTSRMGGAINGALFLQEFVDNRPWVHLDIAGPAYLDKPFGTLSKGATGFGVLTAVRFLELLTGE